MKKINFTLSKAVIAFSFLGLFSQADATPINIQGTGVGTYTWQNTLRPSPGWGGYGASNTIQTNTSLTPFGATAVTTSTNAPTDLDGTGGSSWISTNADFRTGNVGNSYYSYRTTFDLTGITPSSVNIQGLWASDNRGRGIFVNGVEINVSQYGYNNTTTAADGLNDRNQGTSSLETFTILGSLNALNAGLNTVDFVFYNGPNANAAAAGLFATFSSATGNVPEPEVLVLMGLGALAFRASASRRA
jgi:hypothetical protein